MAENPVENVEVKRKRLTPATTVLLSIAAALGGIVFFRIIYFIFTGV